MVAPTFMPWHQCKDKDERHIALINTLKKISEEDGDRLQEHLSYLKIYAGEPQSSNLGFYKPKTAKSSRRKQAENEYRVNYNVVKSVTDTLVSKACLNPPKATLITDGGSIVDRLTATKLDKAVYMTMKNAGLFADWPVLVKHALVHGDCDVKVYADPKEKNVKFERILPPDIYVSRLDSMYGKPLNLYQTSFISKDYLFSQYPQFKDVYESKFKSPHARLHSQLLTENKIDNISDVEEFVELCEAWHLRLDEKTPGRHMIVCQYGVLLDEKYDDYEFPVARLSWNKPHVGYFATGLPEQLESKQRQINIILSFITEAASKARSPKILAKKQGNDEKLQEISIRNNEIAEVLYYSGDVPPQWFSFSGYPATEFERLQWLIRSCYEEVGLNQMSSTGKNILGSGASKVALQEFTSIESDRFQEFGKALDNFMVDLCHKTINALKELKDSGVKEIKGEYKGTLQSIKLNEIDFDRDYNFSIMTSAMLPMTSAARKDFAGDLYNSGVIDQNQYLSLLQIPDLEQSNKMKLAPRNAIEMQIERLIETKDSKYLLVNENTDLAYGLNFVISLLCQYTLSEDETDLEAVNLLETLKLNITSKLNELGIVQQQMTQQIMLEQSAIGSPASVSKTV